MEEKNLEVIPKKGENGQGQLGSEGLAKMAEQSAIRQRLEQLRNELNKKGQGQGNQLNPLIEELKEQQKNIINKNINKETIQRQHDILTRLLESEKAILERGFEEKRESKSVKNQENGNKIIFEEYNKQKIKQIELLRYAEPLYKRYYKEKADEYFDDTVFNYYESRVYVIETLKLTSDYQSIATIENLLIRCVQVLV